MFFFVLLPIPLFLAVLLFFQCKRLAEVIGAQFTAWRGAHPRFDGWWRMAQGEALPGRWDRGR